MSDTLDDLGTVAGTTIETPTPPPNPPQTDDGDFDIPPQAASQASSETDEPEDWSWADTEEEEAKAIIQKMKDGKYDVKTTKAILEEFKTQAETIKQTSEKAFNDTIKQYGGKEVVQNKLAGVVGHLPEETRKILGAVMKQYPEVLKAFMSIKGGNVGNVGNVGNDNPANYRNSLLNKLREAESKGDIMAFKQIAAELKKNPLTI